MENAATTIDRSNPNGVLDVLVAFLKLGLTSFGGPIAHLGYFREEFVIRRKSLNDSAYADVVALCQFLPGPASSQVGFVLGIFRGEPNGLTGAIISVIALSLPGLLLVYGTLPFWDGLRRRPTAQAAMKGANAAVVGILAAAFYSPVWSSAVVTPTDFSLHLPASCS